MKMTPSTYNHPPCPHLRDAAREWGFDLSIGELQKFHDYYAELVEWNRKFNLTAITDYEDVQIQHILDSLSCLLGTARYLECLGARPRLVDVGAGAGVPGFPLKIARPEWELTLVEATRKKTEFLRHISQKLDLPATVIHARAEEVGQDTQHRESYDLVVARAVAELSVLLEYMLPLCRVGGLAVAMKGHAARDEATAAARGLTVLGGELREIIPVKLPGLTETRHLVIVAKTAPTPAKYPRRPGMPAKRPLL